MVIPINFDSIPKPATTNTAADIEKILIAYNVNRAVKSSTGQSLGGGDGGSGLIAQMMQFPGSFIVKDNGKNDPLIGLDGSIESTINGVNINDECKNCNGVGIVSDWMPITT